MVQNFDNAADAANYAHNVANHRQKKVAICTSLMGFIVVDFVQAIAHRRQILEVVSPVKDGGEAA